jgi:hypothetical protein
MMPAGKTGTGRAALALHAAARLDALCKTL